METLLLFDGYPLLHRAYHALPPLKTKNGLPTNVIYGFLSMIHKAVSDFSPQYLSIAFDTPKPTFRKKLFAQYQIQRPKMADDFKIQIPLVKEAIIEAAISQLEKESYEADDIIGTITKKLKNDNLRIIIVTGDRDIFQLIDKNIYVAVPQTGLTSIKIYDRNEVLKKLGLPPEKIVDYKALVGDQSDNYPGAKGIGPKTAIELINHFDTIENLYRRLDDVKSEKIKQILIKEKENVFLSKKLAQIVTTVPIQLELQQLEFNGFNKNLKNFLEKYQMYSLINRFFNKNSRQKKIKNKEKKEEQQGLF